MFCDKIKDLDLHYSYELTNIKSDEEDVLRYIEEINIKKVHVIENRDW